jgi:hypothetical protein
MLDEEAYIRQNDWWTESILENLVLQVLKRRFGTKKAANPKFNKDGRSWNRKGTQLSTVRT